MTQKQDKFKILSLNFHGQKYPPYRLEYWTTLIIRKKSNDIYYHVSTSIRDFVNQSNVTHFEALSFRGVVQSNKLKTNPTYTIQFKLKCDQTFNQYYNEMLKSIGKKYDWKAVLFGFYGQKIQDKNKLYCNEHAFIFFKHYTPDLVNKIQTNLSPKGFRLLAEAFVQGLKYRNKRNITLI